MTQQQQEFTLVAVYHDNDQRFVDSAPGDNVTNALIALAHRLYKDYKMTVSELNVIGVFEGGHDAKDNSVAHADERPERTSQPGAVHQPFTVVSDESAHHVMAADAADAELDLKDSECLEIGAVFEGHLKDISAEVDWDRFYAEAPKSEDELLEEQEELENA
jgi:hypothetical protein